MKVFPPTFFNFKNMNHISFFRLYITLIDPNRSLQTKKKTQIIVLIVKQQQTCENKLKLTIINCLSTTQRKTKQTKIRQIDGRPNTHTHTHTHTLYKPHPAIIKIILKAAESKTPN